MSVLGLDHVQLAMPKGQEQQARSFYGSALGLEEIPKPPELAGRGGVWFRCGELQLHLGVEEPFVPARKAHPAIRLAGYDAFVAKLSAAGFVIRPDTSVPLMRRSFIDDPFGNRLELVDSSMPRPFVDHVGVRIVEAAAASSLLTLAIEPQHFNSHGVVHGAVAFTLADTGMGAALHTVLEAGESCATIEIKINYFRPVLEGQLRCRSEVIHRGKTTATMESTLRVGDTLVAKATGTYAIFPRRPASP
jgi:acyl-CoA thioesterase